VGRGTARIDPDIAKRLGIATGDIVEISSGRKKTAAKSRQGYPDDRGKGIIRIDGATRRNADTSIDKKVKIRKIEAKDGRLIKFSPTDPLRIQGGEAYLKRLLENRVLTQGDFIEILIMGRKVLLVVTSHLPKVDAILVRDTTQIEISEKVSNTINKLPAITYNDIGGSEKEIKLIQEVIDTLAHPELFEKVGFDPPRGILLHGPPGTGKTLIGKALVTENQQVKIFTIIGPEIISRSYGDTVSNLKKIFKDAEKNAPSVIFIDHVATIAPITKNYSTQNQRNYFSVLNATFLSLLDGLIPRGQVVVIGATANPELLDPAFRQGGRFGREIELTLPDKKARLEILKVHTRNAQLTDDINLEKIATDIVGFSGADIANLIREAGMHVIGRIIPDALMKKERISDKITDDVVITQEDMHHALTIVHSLKKKKIQPENE